MPIYPYKCVECKHQFDKVKPFARCKEDDTCPKCRAVGKRIITVPLPAQVAGGTFAQRGNGLQTLGDFPDFNSWIDS